MHQLEAEQQRLEIALLNATSGLPQALEQAALRYETLASRQDVLASGVFRDMLRELTEYKTVMGAFEAFLARHDPMLADGLQRAEVGPLLAGVAALRPAVHDLVLAQNAHLTAIQAELRTHVIAEHRASSATIATLGAILLGFAGYALVVLRRAQRSEEALARSEKELRSALAAAQAASAAKSAFLANMSHELRTPLNAVIGFAELLTISAAQRLDPHQLEYVRDIQASGRHLLGIIGTILETCKLETGAVELSREEVSAPELVRGCVETVAPLAESHGVAIELGALDRLPPIDGDPARLKQVFLNLLSNAVKYSSQAGRVRVSGRREERSIAIEIADEGAGMRGEDIERALRPFGRLRDARTSNGEGIGLGLSIANALVGLHGGSLAIASELGRGTRVTVTLPAVPSPTGVKAAALAPVRNLPPRPRRSTGLSVAE